MADIIPEILVYMKSRLWFPMERTYSLLGSFVALAVAVLMQERGEELGIDAIPYLFLQGPYGTGKTETGVTLAALAGGSHLVDVTKAAMFRWQEQNPGRLLSLDEASGLSRRDYVHLLNSGYRRAKQGDVLRVEPSAEKNTAAHFGVKVFRTFGPKVFADNRRMPLDALESRCIAVECTKYDMRSFTPIKQDETRERGLHEALAAWVQQHAAELKTVYEKWHGEALFFSEPRERQIWSPVLAVAEVIGLLDLVKECVQDRRDQRKLRASLGVDFKLDGLLASSFPEFLRLREIKGNIPTRATREFLDLYLDGDRPADRTVATAMRRAGYTHKHTRDGEVWIPPRSLWGRIGAGLGLK